ncbi:MAG TPA: hypothetical protein PLX06_14540 [Fimbriimonadaceae bacterium]|nr:hypothetical protein [Fimbriimonadaceae bacterium]
MRTTLTLDADIAAELEAFQKQNRTSLKRAVNHLLREGLQAVKAKPKRARKTVTRVFDVDHVLIPNLEKTGEVLDWLDAMEWIEKHGPRAA